ncbi:hypothetical protein [Geothrix sp. PMB-07]|uniref:hypothetical protein n=1 Tax=Geothrix sp. PMB-07 TaxID=3068640 RepID=UPI002740F664|nr:hypothetical protein [Geothrix sp. PMB-07]WLT31614.1 hypothetical protein Q9293_18070 [Geothrix sp. PMB-07]
MFRTFRPSLLALTAGCLPIFAQEAGAFSASLNLANGTAALKEVTGASTGFTLDGAWDSPAQALPFRVGLSVSTFSDGTHTRGLGLDANGDPQADLTLKGPALTTYQAYGAMRFDLAKDLRLYFGLSANRHHLASDLLDQGGGQYVRGTKIGTRADLEYRATPHLSVVGAFQWVELGPGPSGSQFLNPSWFQAGIRYAF